MSLAEQSAHTNWPDRIHAVFKRHGIRQVGYVPDHGLTRLIELCCQDNEITDVVLTTEAEGPALALGATLGGERAALMMQSSGVGNCLNAFSLLRNCAVPCVILVTMRGEFNDFNPWQVPMGQITEPTLRLAGFQTYRVEQEADVEPMVESACSMAFGGGNMQIAILLSQRMVDRSHQGH
jgi:sulfopyruvate decarboxylase TPP-binding subunit